MACLAAWAGWTARRILPVGAAALLASCERPLSALHPAGPSAQAIAQVWWWMLGVGTTVLLAVVGLWLAGMSRRHAADDTDAARRAGLHWIVGGGVVLPLAAIGALLVFGTGAGRHALPWPMQPPPLRIDVTGHRWWWQMQYPGHGHELRNELRLPVGRPVDVRTRSADVIHSFWVPRLGGKLDAIPGRSVVVRLQADAPGTYRGVCAEFCGTGHAHMAMTVVAMDAREFDAWLASAPRAEAAAGPTPPASAAGPR